jgi:hypothetical protein
MRNIYVPLPEQAVDQLRELAQRELRGAKEQAAALVLDGLRRAGFDPEQPGKRSAPPPDREP